MKTTQKQLQQSEQQQEESRSLYSLTGDYAVLQAKLLDFAANDDLLEDEERDEVFAALDAIDERVEAKVSNIVKLMKFLEQRAACVDGEQQWVAEEAERLKNRVKRFGRKVEGLRDYLVLNFDRLGIKKLETDIATVSVGEPAERVEVDETRVFEWPDEIFRACCEEVVKVNRSSLKQMYGDKMAGLPGVVVVPGKRRVSIR